MPQLYTEIPTVAEFIHQNGLNQEAADSLRYQTEDIQNKVMARGNCANVRDQVAVIKKRIQDAQRGVAVGIYSDEVEEFIRGHGACFDEKAKEVLRTSAPPIQRLVLDRGPCTEAKNPSAILLCRVRDAQKGRAIREGREIAEEQSTTNSVIDEYYGAYGLLGAPMSVGMAGIMGTPMDEERKRTAGEAFSDGLVPKVHWLSFGAGSALVQAGYPGDGPAIQYEKHMSVFQQAYNILAELVSNVNSVVQIEHDEEWKKFPGIGEKFRSVSGQENCFAIATSSEHGVWAAGFHASRKGREAAAKLALGLAISAGTAFEAGLGVTYPDFGLILNGEATASYKMAKIQKQLGLALGAPEAPAESFGIPTPTVNSVIIDSSSPLVKQGYLNETAAIEWDEKFKDILYDSTRYLKILCGAMMVEVDHDADWKKFPEVGRGLKTSGLTEGCFAIAMCPDMGKWGVGIAASWKNREMAAKLALSLTVAHESPLLQATITEYPIFYTLCINAGVIA